MTLIRNTEVKNAIDVKNTARANLMNHDACKINRWGGKYYQYWVQESMRT